VYQWAKKKDAPKPGMTEKYVEDPIFQKNFVSDFTKTLDKKFSGLQYSDIDFSEAYNLVDKEKEEKEKTRQLEIVNEQRKKDEEYARRLAAGLSRRSIRAVQPVNYDETGGSNDNNVKDKYENLPTLKQLDFQYEREISYLEKRHFG
jgi:hypothetical protein